MTSAARVPDDVLSALDDYATGLEPQQSHAKNVAENHNTMFLELGGGKKPPPKILTKEDFKAYSELMKGVKGTIKFLDEERKISVGPLNEQVKAINTWFNPAINGGKAVIALIERMLSGYLIERKKEEQRLLAEAQAQAQAVLATAPADGRGSMAEVANTIQAASSIMPEKVVGVSDKPVWTFTVVDASKLDRRFLMPDMDAIKLYVKENGDQNVPDGVAVEADYKFTVRGSK